MPKKTKREKIMAEHRRETFVFRAPQKDTTTPLPADTEELKVIKHDLAWTIILAVVAIGIELGIYWKLNGV